MNPKNLLSFVKVAECGTFNRAAAHLRITQPALSRRINALEDELRLKLFERHGNRVTLTDTGVLLRDRAEGLLRHLDQIRNDLTSGGNVPTGNLSVGLPAPFRSMLAKTIVPAFCLEYPQVKLHVFDNSPMLIFNSLLAGSVELGVISTVEPNTGLAVERFVTERLFIAASLDHGFRLDRTVPIGRLREFPIVQASAPGAVRSLLTRHFADKGVQLNFNVEAESIQLMIDVAASGHSVTVLPYSALMDDLDAGRICAAPLSQLTIDWVIARPAERQISRASRCFSQAMRELARAEIEGGRWLGASFHETKPI